jgi:hypothetical protein
VYILPTPLPFTTGNYVDYFSLFSELLCGYSISQSQNIL